LATWQFTFELIPEEWSKKENYSNKKLLNNEYDFDTEVSWKEYQTSKDIILQVKKILPTSNTAYT